MTSRITVPEIASRLNIGRLAVYAMLEGGHPRCAHRSTMDHHHSRLRTVERTCGMRTDGGLEVPPKSEQTVPLDASP